MTIFCVLYERFVLQGHKGVVLQVSTRASVQLLQISPSVGHAAPLPANPPKTVAVPVRSTMLAPVTDVTTGAAAQERVLVQKRRARIKNMRRIL